MTKDQEKKKKKTSKSAEEIDKREQAGAVERALKKAVSQVDSPQRAEEVLEDLESAAGEMTAADVQQSEPPVESTADAAREVQEAERTAPAGEEPEEVIEAAARVVVAADQRSREALSEAAQDAMHPEQEGETPTVADEREREYLREAVIRRLKPLEALDASLFLAINHLPHTPLLNRFFHGLTVAFNTVAPWYAEMGITALHRRTRAQDVIRESVLPLLITSSLVELIIKPYFRRKRPFIAIIQAIVIGKKPGTWSFPSGHAAAAFAGAWLLNHQSPRLGPLRYVVASMVAFSRVYLGDHYPGDVASGSLIGLLSAEFFHRLLKRRKKNG